jgi:hypothetical protein
MVTISHGIRCTDCNTLTVTEVRDRENGEVLEAHCSNCKDRLFGIPVYLWELITGDNNG